MVILNAEQTRQVDALTIKNEPIESIDLMERASLAFSDFFCSRFIIDHKIAVVCGTGNNGGDGLAISRILLKRGFKPTTVVVGNSEGGSADFHANLTRLSKLQNPSRIDSQSEIIDFDDYDIVIDAMFGSGLTRPVTGLNAKVIGQINSSSATIIAVDIASGLYGDRPPEGVSIIQANTTVSFQLPKLAFLIPSNHQYVGEWEVLDIGLDVEFINEQESDYRLLDRKDISKLLRLRQKFDHKGTFGHGLLIGGSYGKMGAMVLAANAFMRSGAGLLTTHVPKCGYSIMQTSVPEAMAVVDKAEQVLTEKMNDSRYSALGIGPGLGTDPDTVKAIKAMILDNQAPLVIDADGLNIIARHSELIELLPENTILTPHVKEFERLAGQANSDWQRLELARAFAISHKVILVLKGAHTAVISPIGQVNFNSTGNPGMATGGSGDVLTGIITALLTQGYNPIDAACLGVYLHGSAGDLAALDLGEISMNASDLINYLPDAFALLL